MIGLLAQVAQNRSLTGLGESWFAQQVFMFKAAAVVGVILLVVIGFQKLTGKKP
jgi:hypothetical protein